MRVLVDDGAAVHQGAGIGRYARNVVRAAIGAARAGGDDVDWVLTWAGGRGAAPPFLDAAFDGLERDRRVDVRRLPIGDVWATRLWHRARLPVPIQALAHRRADVVYSPDLAVAPSGRTPRVPTIHDLAFMVRPDLYPPRLLRYLTAVTPRQIAGASHIVTVSDSSRTDLIERAGARPERISVVPNGVDGRFFAASPPDRATRTRFGLPDDYLLTVGSLEPRKNHLGLFAALDRLPGDDRLPLVVAGRAGWGNEPILAELRRREAGGSVVFLPDVPDDVLPALYAGAAAMVYPALHEGFGIPVIEAMATGTPVVVNDTPALRESAGPHGIVVDAADPDALATAIVSAFRPDVRGEADRRVWARRWSWDRSGTLLLKVFRQVGG